MDGGRSGRTVWLFYHTWLQSASGRGFMECGGHAAAVAARAAAWPQHSRLRELLDRAGGELALFAEPSLAQHLLHEARVQRVAGADRGDLADDRTADPAEGADKVEHLVAGGVTAGYHAAL